MFSNRSWIVLSLIVVTLLSGCGKTGEETAAQKEESADFKVTMVLKSEAEADRAVEVYFMGDHAVEVRGGEVSGVFDLAKGTWRDVQQQQTATLAESVAWAAERTKVARETLAAEEDTPERARRMSFVDPQFVTEDAPGMVVIKNDLNLYRVAAADLSPEMVRAYLQYDRLNAYRTAMVRNQWPPAVQLGITSALESRGMAPKSMYIELRGSSPASVTYTYEPLSAEDAEQVKGWLAN